MTSQLFRPAEGQQAQWVPVYEFLKKLDYGQVVTFKQLDNIVGRDFRADRAPLYRAMRELERKDHKTLISHQGLGYAIAKPEQHRTQAEKHRKRSYRQVSKARRKIASAPRDLLPEQELRWLDETEIRLAQLESGLRHTNRRVAILEKKVSVKEDAMTEIQQALAKLRAKGLID